MSFLAETHIGSEDKKKEYKRYMQAQVYKYKTRIREKLTMIAPRSFGCASCACAPMPMLAIIEKRRGVKSFMLVGYSGNLVCIFDVYLFQSMIFSMCAGAGV